jgi:N-acetylglucosamine-6-phosphate deacetylase
LRGALAGAAGDALLIEGRTITWVGSGRPPRLAEDEIDAPPGGVIAPGFIDLQVNGYAGYDVARGGEAIGAISLRLPATGVTSFLPTLVSSPLDVAAELVRAARTVQSPGARVLGVHLEGPFLNPDFKGAHRREWLAPPAPANVDHVLRQPPRMMTIAPELPGALEAVARLRRARVIVSAGHTGADYEQGVRGINAGIRFGTHLYNAMRPFHHRSPGVAAALLADPRVTVGLIADGAHLHPAACEQTIRLKGWRRVTLTTDQTAAAGAGRGTYRLAGRAVSSDGETVRTSDGTLAGSVATMDGLVRRVAGNPSIGRDKALAMASSVPARVLGDPCLGVLRAGAAADVVVLDADLTVRMTLVGGVAVHTA